MPLQYNPTDSRFLTVAQSRTNNGQKDIRIILDIPTNDFYSLDDDGNFNIIGGGGGSQGLDSVLAIDNRSGFNNIFFSEPQYGLNFFNGSLFKEGTNDAGLGGANGVAQICSVGYELKWEAGRLYVMEQGGITIRQSLCNLSNLPTLTDDNTKGYVVGSLWTMDNGDIYKCISDTTGGAVWTRISNYWDGELEIEIKNTNILTCGTNPIQLLPAPGVGFYLTYEMDLKKPASTTIANANGIDYFYIGTDTYEGNILQVSDYNSVANVVFQYESRNGMNTANIPGGIIPVYPITTNENIIFTTYNGVNPSAATGSIFLTIRYKINKF